MRMSKELPETTEQLNIVHELEFDTEVEAQAITLAAYSIIKEMYEANMISLEELNLVRAKYQIHVD